MSANDYRAEERAARDEAEKATAEACKAIEATASGDAAAIAEHYSAAEEHADNARNHARKAHTYAADEAARNAANAVIEAEMTITEKAYAIGEALADEANATNAQRMSAHNAAFAELTAQPWTATAEDRAAVNAMVEEIAKGADAAKAASPTRYGMTEAESIADAAVCSLLSAYTAATFEDYSDEQAQAAFRVAAAELIPESQRPAGYEAASPADYETVNAMLAAIAQR